MEENRGRKIEPEYTGCYLLRNLSQLFETDIENMKALEIVHTTLARIFLNICYCLQVIKL